MAVRTAGQGKSECCSVMGQTPVALAATPPTLSGAQASTRLTTVQAVGAVSSEAAEWYAIDGQAVSRNVRRLQARIVKAVTEGRWGKVRALQRLLPSCSHRQVSGSPSESSPSAKRNGGSPWNKHLNSHPVRVSARLGFIVTNLATPSRAR